MCWLFQEFDSARNLACLKAENWLEHRTNAFVWLLVLIDGSVALGDIPWDSRPIPLPEHRDESHLALNIAPTPQLGPPLANTPPPLTPHTLLTSSSKKQASNSPTGPGGLPRKPSCAGSGLSHVCALARCAQSQRRWDTGSRSGPAHCRVHISGASRPGGALTCLNSLQDLPAAANIFAGFTQHGIRSKHFPHYGLPRYAP